MLQKYVLTMSEVDLGGSLAVASKGLFATGVSTDLNGKSCKDFITFTQMPMIVQ